MSSRYEVLNRYGKTYARSIYKSLMIAPVSELAPVKLPAFLAPRFTYRVLVLLGARWEDAAVAYLAAEHRDASLQMRTESGGRGMCVPGRSCRALRVCRSVRATVKGRRC